jgi:hypothetical protein
MPYTFRNVVAEYGSSIHLRITGDSGGDWTVVRNDVRWDLFSGAPDPPSASVSIDQAIAWRLFTKGLSPEEAEESATIDGDQRLGRHVLQMVSVIA